MSGPPPSGNDDSAPEASRRARLRRALAAADALCGAYFEPVAPGHLRSTVVEGLFPLLETTAAAPTTVTTRAAWVARVLRGEDVPVAGTWLGEVWTTGRAQQLGGAAVAARLPPAADPALAVSALLAVPVRRDGRVVAVVGLARPVAGGEFSAAALAAAERALAAPDEP